MECDAKWEEDIMPSHRRYKEHYIFEFPND